MEKRIQQLQQATTAVNTLSALPAVYGVSKMATFMEGVQTLEACLYAGAPKIKNLIVQCGDVRVRAVVSSYLIYLSEMMGGALGEMQTEECTRVIVTKYPHLTLVDIYYVLRSIWSGEKKIYGKMTIASVLECMDDYEHLRACRCEEMHIIQHSHYKQRKPLDAQWRFLFSQYEASKQESKETYENKWGANYEG